jgi:hypothetical protein
MWTVSRKDVSDIDVVIAVAICKAENTTGFKRWPYELLSEITGECEKVCYRAMERAFKRGLLDYGVSLRSGFLTPEGKKLLEIVVGNE